MWHKDTSLGGADVVILPGGFAHGDYLRTGAIARFSPIMQEVQAFAAAGGRCSASATASRCCSKPGCCRARCCATAACSSAASTCTCRVEQTDTPFTAACRPGQVLRIPIAHGEGNYYAEPDVIARLEKNRQVIFRYVDAAGAGHRRGESERLGQQHRRHLQRGAQRRRPDAAPGARVRAGGRQRRRPRAVRVGRGQGADAAGSVRRRHDDASP